MKTLFLGAGGAGMKGLAYLLEQCGETIVRYDDSPGYDGITQQEAMTLLPTLDRIVYTDAAPSTHPIRVAATDAAVQQVAYQEALGIFAASYTTIAVTGTHGKSSTTAFLTHIAIEAGLDPTVLVGAAMPTLPGSHARVGKGEYFIVEADEYRNHFFHLRPAHIIITSIDFDHPDSFSSLEDTEDAYTHFISLLHKGGSVIVPREQHEKHPRIQWPSSAITVSEDAIGDIHVPLPGFHMQMNAALACKAATLMGIPEIDAKDALATFPGLARRFELLGTFEGIEIRSDYGHHPTEIAATIAGARAAYPSHTLITIFEAHMPLRLHTFLADFATALGTADAIIIAPPFIPEGRDSEGAHEDIVRLHDMLVSHKKKVISIDTFQNLPQALAECAKNIPNHPVAIGFSAGKIDTELRNIVKKG